MPRSIHLTAAEGRLAELVWRETPLASPALVALAERELGWKKSTTYTVLKKLCGKGVLRNESARVSAALTREELAARQSRGYVEDTFGGSLPKFLASFIGGGTLTPEQAAELRRLIEDHTAREEAGHG